MTTLRGSREDRSWNDTVQNLFDVGMAMPDSDSRDYSFASIYLGPQPNFPVPKAEIIDQAPQMNFFLRPDTGAGSRADILNEKTSQSSSVATSISPAESGSHSLAESLDAVEVDQDEDIQGVVSSSLRSDIRFSSFHVENKEELSYNGEYHVERTGFDFWFPGSQTSSCRASNSNSDNVYALSNGTSHKSSANQSRKKRECYSCSKASKFQDRETCLVCLSKFCSRCVLKVMGSMPEGRKCLTCVGQYINESRRPTLGKPSRLLNCLLNPLEVQLIMKAERTCVANQLRPDQVIVNARPLNAQEFAELLGCYNPPSQLKPGDYWYDKAIGYWGKKGEKPDRIITAGLNVGGDLEENASGGCTKVYINDREITKVELKMLKLAKVQCPPETHLWVSSSGEYMEVGQKNPCGNIWGKTSVRLLCPLFSLPTPSYNKNTPDGAQPILEYLEQKSTYKILLLGLEGSGTSTIFKQAKLSYTDGKFTHEELQNVKLMIQSNIFKYMSLILEARERFEDEDLRTKSCVNRENGLKECLQSHGSEAGISKSVYTISDRLKHEAEWLLDIMACGNLDKYFPASAREYAPFIEEMWKDPAIQATYKRRSELPMLPDIAKYFLDRAVEISSNDYEPTKEDVLLVGGLTQGAAGIAELEFSLNEKKKPPADTQQSDCFDEPASSVSYHLIRVNVKGMVEGCKWLEMFEAVHAIIFCVALDEYDQIWTDGHGGSPPKNKMVLSRDLLESIRRHPLFEKTPFILLLNKYDAFEGKISQVPLTTCDWFQDFDPVRASHHTSQQLANQAYTYIAHKFKKHFESIHPNGQKLYTYQLKARDISNVKSAFLYVKVILDWEESKELHLKNLPLDTMDSSELSTFSGLLLPHQHC